MASHVIRASAVKRLYKDILRQHRFALPPKHRELGDRYVRSEFKAHKEATGDQVVQFMHAWRSYLEQIRNQRGQVGRSLSAADVSHLNDEQREQLFRLKQQASSSSPSTAPGGAQGR
ncbi:unnamed protein product [Ectocarpus sp. CCAP 1310/34]|nr:unnamed protein product [Ectocarpus sp. CCAP 1310/34]